MRIKDALNEHQLVERIMPVLQKNLNENMINRVLYIPVGECRGVSRAGYWSPSQMRLFVNTSLHGEPWKNVFLHELAHCIATHKYALCGMRVKAHGYEWRVIMMHLGLRPERCTNAEESAQLHVNDKHHYTCQTCNYVIKKPRRNDRLLSDLVRHKGCRYKVGGGKLTYYYAP
jgi:predicted SprT family Zn-dependent metalloprotease